MANSREEDTLRWYCPEKRGVLPLESFHTPARLAKALRKQPFEIRTNTAFSAVIRGCAEVRPDTWINPPIEALYTELHRMGFAHSVESWREGELLGGLYGVAIGGAFFGESMFSRATNASKAALVALAEKLTAAGYALLDTQYVNDHLKQFGAVEISRADYLRRLEQALTVHPGHCF